MSTPAYSWSNVPIRVSPSDVPHIQFSEEELTKINEYGDSFFDKRTIDRRPSQWSNSLGKNKRNPNTTGIKGEWAGIKYFAPKTNLNAFLKDRPWKMSDVGDVILVSKSAKIFDYKTRIRPVTVEELLSDDTWTAEMDHKFSDREKFGYLQAFVFCAYQESIDTVHLMGWMTAEEYFESAQVIPAGTPIEHAKPYPNVCCSLPYRRLHLMEDLKDCEYLPITQEMTISLKKSWEKSHILPLEQYV